MARALAGLVVDPGRPRHHRVPEGRSGRPGLRRLAEKRVGDPRSPHPGRSEPEPGAPVVTPIPWNISDTAEPDQWSITDVDTAPEVGSLHQTLDPDPIIEAPPTAEWISRPVSTGSEGNADAAPQRTDQRPPTPAPLPTALAISPPIGVEDMTGDVPLQPRCRAAVRYARDRYRRRPEPRGQRRSPCRECGRDAA